MDDIVKRLRERNFSVFDGIVRRMSDLLSGEAADEIERLRAALQRVIDHDPKTPGLHYDSIEQLLDSVVACARSDLEPSNIQ